MSWPSLSLAADSRASEEALPLALSDITAVAKASPLGAVKTIVLPSTRALSSSWGSRTDTTGMPKSAATARVPEFPPVVL